MSIYASLHEHANLESHFLQQTTNKRGQSRMDLLFGGSVVEKITWFYVSVDDVMRVDVSESNK